MRRLTRAEYRATVKDLLGVTLKAEPYGGASAGFDNDISGQGVSSFVIEQQLADAETVAATALADPAKLLGCPMDDGCVRRFLVSFGQRAFRRPLAPDEVDALFASYVDGKTGADARTGVAVALQHILMSPAFLYRVEVGRAAPSGRPRPLTSWELAARLSYFLWGSMPDQALFEAAAQDKLSTPAQLSAQVQRMLRDPSGQPHPAAAAMVTSFHTQWLGLREVESLAKDSTMHAPFAAARTAIRQETERFAQEIFWSRAPISDLFGARFSFLNEKLAPIYGVTGVTGDALRRVELDPRQRAGLLTHASFLSITSGERDELKPITRGHFVRERFLCTEIPPAPEEVPPLPSGPVTNERERYRMHSEVPACAGCHKLFDPIGFPLFAYDAIGRFRTEWPKGGIIDTSGELTQTDVDGPVKNAVELAERLARSQTAQSCVLRHWFRYMVGREEGEADACLLSKLAVDVASRGGRLEDIVLALVSADAFTHLPPAAP